MLTIDAHAPRLFRRLWCILVALADLAGLQGDDRERLRLLEQAHRLFDEQGATGHARRVAKDIAAAAA